MANIQLDFQDRMIDALEANCNLFTTIDVPIIKVKEDGTTNGIAFMLTPVGQETVFYDHSRLRMYAFQITVRHTDQQLILDNLYSINRYIDGLGLGDIQSQNGSFEFNTAITSSVPNLVQANTNGYIYVSNFQMELLLY